MSKKQKLIMVKSASGGHVLIHEDVAKEFNFDPANTDERDVKNSQLLEMAELERKWHPINSSAKNYEEIFGESSHAMTA